MNIHKAKAAILRYNSLKSEISRNISLQMSPKKFLMSKFNFFN